MTHNNLLVITHRRSGTHLTIDSIRNNFSVFRQHECLVLETLHSAHPEAMSLADMRRRVERGGHVIKTHYRHDEFDEMPAEHRDFMIALLERSTLVYVVRHGMDVMASLYEFRRRHDPEVQRLSFGEFLRSPTFDPGKPDLNKMAYWAAHVRGWLQSPWRDRLLLVRYEDWIDHYHETLRRIAKHLGLRRDWRRRDVRMSRQGRHDRIVRTWVEPRKGVVGDHVHYFSAADADRFWELCSDVMNQFGYECWRAASAT